MKLIKKYIHFFTVFVKDLGGVRVFILKIIQYIRENGIKGAFHKMKYILNQAKLITGYNQIKEKPLNSANLELQHNYRVCKPNLNTLKFEIESFDKFPVISVIMPTYNTNPVWLTEAIESVRNQIYSNWELCIADDNSTNQECIKVLKDYEKRDERIKVVFRKKNGHISKASNSALEIATGDYIALLDHDDLLSPDALFWVVKTINKHPNAKLIYSDEDKIDANGIRKDPYFKCDWNYSLFLSQNFISHLGVYEIKTLKIINGFRVGYEGSQDYDLVLRFIEEISPNEIYHIPRVLYHWRIHRNSTSYKSDEKPYAQIAAKKAIGEHLDRNNIKATVTVLENMMYRVKYTPPAQTPKISIIIPTRNNWKVLKRCIESICSKTDYNNYEILIVNNSSDDIESLNYFNIVNRKEKVTVIDDNREFNFSALNNEAVKSAKGEFICFLNDDTEVINKDWLTEMISIGVQKNVGAVGARLWYPNNTLQHGGVILGVGGVGSHAHLRFPKGNDGYFNRAGLLQEFSAVTAACMLVPKKVFIEAGGFDEENLTVAFNDVDLCLKIRELNYRIVWTPYAELYHYESYSRGIDKLDGKNKRFFLENEYMLIKWSKWIKNDPAYSPNLTLNKEDFSFAWPPRLDFCE